MADPITYKSNAQQIIEAVLSYLFQYEMQRHQSCIDRIASNAVHWRPFLYQGETFRPSNANGARGSLPEVAWPDMEKHLLDKRRLDTDSKTFWQILFSLVTPCQSLQDVRDTLPDFIVDMIPQLSVLPRIRDEAFTLDDERVKRQYLKHRDKMELYARLRSNPGLAQLMGFYNYEA